MNLIDLISIKGLLTRYLRLLTLSHPACAGKPGTSMMAVLDGLV
jgi:hypothetical protein